MIIKSASGPRHGKCLVVNMFIHWGSKNRFPLAVSSNLPVSLKGSLLSVDGGSGQATTPDWPHTCTLPGRTWITLRITMLEAGCREGRCLTGWGWGPILYYITLHAAASISTAWGLQVLTALFSPKGLHWYWTTSMLPVQKAYHSAIRESGMAWFCVAPALTQPGYLLLPRLQRQVKKTFIGLFNF